MHNWIMGAITAIGLATSGVGVYLLATTGNGKNAIEGGILMILIAYAIIGCGGNTKKKDVKDSKE